MTRMVHGRWHARCTDGGRGRCTDGVSGGTQNGGTGGAQTVTRAVTCVARVVALVFACAIDMRPSALRVPSDDGMCGARMVACTVALV